MSSDLTYKALQREVAKLERKVARNADEVKAAAKVIDAEATETLRESEQIAAKSVDRDSVADSQELSRVIKGLSDGILTYAAKAQDTAKQAKAAGDQAKSTHGGFQEAFDRSSVAGLENVDRDWFAQE